VQAVDGQPMHAKGRIEAAPGARITITEAGGGGFGDPRQRDPASVRLDVAEGYVTADAARTVYGLEG
jgi:N-methylhydantoinase B